MTNLIKFRLSVDPKPVPPPVTRTSHWTQLQFSPVYTQCYRVSDTATLEYCHPLSAQPVGTGHIFINFQCMSNSKLLITNTKQGMKYQIPRQIPSIYISLRGKKTQYSDTSANEWPCQRIFRVTKIFFAVFRTRLTNMDSANECFSGCAR